MQIKKCLANTGRVSADAAAAAHTQAHSVIQMHGCFVCNIILQLLYNYTDLDSPFARVRKKCWVYETVKRKMCNKNVYLSKTTEMRF